MINSVLVLLQNLALLLALVLILDTFGPRKRRAPFSVAQLVAGLLLSAIGVAVMLTPLTMMPGVKIDARSVLLGLSGLFFGVLPTAIAMLTMAIFRFFQGGAGAFTGILNILLIGSIGLAWRHVRKAPLEKTRWWEYYLFGLLTHGLMLVGLFTLPWPMPLAVLRSVTLPVMLAYPVGTLLLGLLITKRLQREHSVRALVESEEQLRHASSRLKVSEALLAKSQEISHLGTWELDLQANTLTWTDEVYRLFGLQPGQIEASYEKFLDMIPEEDRFKVHAAYDSSVRENQDIYEIDHRIVQQDSGEQRYVHEKCLHFRDASGRIIRSVGMVQDITDRKEYEQSLQRSVEEKNNLIKELYHRTKNNMQVILAILSLKANSQDDKALQDTLGDVSQRIRAMSLVNQLLYKSQNLSRINLNEYLQLLTESVLDSFTEGRGRIRIQLDCEPVQLLIDEATPCGLLVNELLTNSCKHAFPDGREGLISIKIGRYDGNQLQIEYHDDGVGLSLDTGKEPEHSFGLDMIQSLVEHQLEGDISTMVGDGLGYLIRFEIDGYQERVQT
ncbi:MAG: PAS domain-containing protein [Spirochaetes bacterium]|nr:PAS domain-containing protein [Spirochaetota bacterium]MBU0956318.1 PAS domain-containing protein [Spirochaetota bacterium]